MLTVTPKFYAVKLYLTMLVAIPNGKKDEAMTNQY